MFPKAVGVIPRVVFRLSRAPALPSTTGNISILGIASHKTVSSAAGRSYYTVARKSNAATNHVGTRHFRTTDVALKDISFEDLEALIRGGNIQLIDVREPSEISQTGMIRKAINIPLGQVKDALLLSDEAFENRYRAPKPQPYDHNVVFYGMGPIKSEAAVQLAAKAGYTHARHYGGGWEEYSKKSKA